ncbi:MULTISPECIES: Crp/Fnr family transcriptional regulator [unclassified Halorhodospira]|uniref:Crp/Fnr family transcriptional regulator n=1 Tax=unclassified Halorhodospira TaxID=2626748 RepID=UPI001EE97334|nr:MULTISPECIES: cyclic nucleotide-binding domain-containing protein [unclassified Halorhodospira]MCG5540195.1 cyclic nucleotide-binding domain-containing protein [Halorhodospira sp. M39old]MCG5545104.1 cyclic nucleotide-binding domain-containing protein [Halorhodospira sp. M38]
MPASIANILSDQEFFKGLERAHVEFLAECASPRTLEQDEVLFRHGDAARAFYLIRAGGIVLEVPAISGPTLEVQRLGTDQILGWSWLIPPYRWNFNARAEDATELLEFDGAAIIERCESDPAFGYQILKRFSALMSKRLDVARERMMDQWNPPGFA